MQNWTWMRDKHTNNCKNIKSALIKTNLVMVAQFIKIWEQFIDTLALEFYRSLACLTKARHQVHWLTRSACIPRNLSHHVGTYFLELTLRQLLEQFLQQLSPTFFHSPDIRQEDCCKGAWCCAKTVTCSSEYWNFPRIEITMIFTHVYATL